MDNELQKNKVKEITGQLEQGVKDLFESKKYMDYLRTMSKFHNYSFNNTLLIHMQKPDARLVAGYYAWKDVHGRQVLKGEKGIKILAPSPYKKTILKEKLDEKGNIVLDKNGHAVMEKTEIKAMAFKVVSVFDVSQTSGRELPQLGVSELFGEVREFDSFFEAVKKSCQIPIAYEKITSGAKGYCTSDRIALKEGISQIQSIKTAIHEIAHHRLHFGGNEKISTGSKEVEAESVAYTVCSHYGIDTSEYSFGYIAGWSAGKDMPELKKSLEIIQQTASEIILEIDRNLKEMSVEKNICQGKSADRPEAAQNAGPERRSVLRSLHEKQRQLKNEPQIPKNKGHEREEAVQ